MIRSTFLTVLIAFTLISCEKFDKDCNKDLECSFCLEKDFPGKKGEKDKGDIDAAAGDKVKDNHQQGTYGEHNGGCSKDSKSEIKEIIVEPILYDEECGCATSGLIKYVKDNKTIALVKYTEDGCKGIATKILCHDGDCQSKKAKCCTFEQDCSVGE